MNGSSEELPREGSVLFNFNDQDEDNKKKTLKRWKKMNKYLVIPLYRIKLLPSFGFGKIFLLLKTKGWKSEKIRRTPLEYRKYKERFIIFAARGENATWIKNMRAYPNNVEVTIGFHTFKPRIEFISDINHKLEILKWYVEKNSKAAKMLFGWDSKKDNLQTTNFERLVNLLTLVSLYED